MIRLKNKKAEEKKAADDAAAAAAVVTTSEQAAAAGNAAATPDNNTNYTNGTSLNGHATEPMKVEDGADGDGGLKLLGIGGKSSRSADPNVKRGGKRKKPGELRIQKGLLDIFFCTISLSDRGA
jgi:hypothetical protein